MEYSINIKGILDSATTTINLNTTLQEISKSITFTIQNITINPAALTNIQQQINSAISTATANVTPKTAGGTTPGASINPINQVGAFNSLDAIQAKVAEISAANNNAIVDVKYNSADIDKATAATVKYTNAQGLLAEQTISVDEATKQLTVSAGQAADNQTKIANEQVAAASQMQAAQDKTNTAREASYRQSDAGQAADEQRYMASIQAEANYENKIYDSELKASNDKEALDAKNDAAELDSYNKRLDAQEAAYKQSDQWQTQDEQRYMGSLQDEANFQNKTYDQQLAQMQRYQQQSAEAMASTAGKNVADPTVQKLQSDAQALNVAATENIEVLKSGTTLTDEMSESTRVLGNSVRTSSTEFQSANNNVKSFGDMVENDITKVAQWFIATTVVMGALQQIGNGIQYIQDLNAALTNIQIVTNGTAQDMQNLATNFNNLATTLGSTTIEVANGALAWEKQGYSAQDANKLITASTMLSKLGIEDSTQATSDLTSILNSFQLKASDAMGVLDTLTTLSSKYAVSTGGLASALQNSGAIAEQAGVSYQELAELVAVASNTTQKSTDVTSQNLTQMFNRMSQVKAGASVDEFGESISNVQKTLDQFGIQIENTATGDFIPFGQILDEVGSKWNTLNTTEQGEIATSIGSARNKTTFLALMQNWNEVQQAGIDVTNDAGAATQKYSDYLDSNAAAANRLTDAANKMWSATINSDVITFFYNVGADALNAITAMGGLMNVVLGLVGAFLLLNIEKYSAGLLSLIGNAGQLTSIFSGFSTNIGLFAEAMMGGASATDALALSFGTATAVVAPWLLAIGLLIGAVSLYTSYINQGSALDAALSSSTSKMEDNRTELDNLATQYQDLASKQDKSADDLQNLTNIQDTVNTKYGALKDGINLYTDAVNNNSDAIENNINWMNQQSIKQLQAYVSENQPDYQKAENYLNNPVGVMGPTGGMTPEEAADYYKKEIQTSGDPLGYLTAIYDSLEKQISAYKDIVQQYTNVQQTLQTQLENTDATGYAKRFGGETPTSMVTATQTTTETPPETPPVTDETTAETAYQEVLKDTISIIQQKENAEKQALSDELTAYTDTINAEKQALADQTDAEKQALEDQKQAYDDKINAEKQATDDKVATEKESLQNSLDAYTKQIDAEKLLISDKQAELTYDQQLADENKSISDIQNEIYQLQFDNSDEANGKRLTLQDQLRTAQEAKDKTVNDYAVQTQTEALDQQLTNYKDNITAQTNALDDYQKHQDQIYANDIKSFDQNIANKEKAIEDYQKKQDTIYDADLATEKATIDAKTKAIDDYLAQTGTVTADAMKQIASNSGTFYDQLQQWNLKYGSGVDDIITKWKDAITYIQQYASDASSAGIMTNPVQIMPDGTIRLHDTGGWVSDQPTLDSQHQFGILMNNEYVATPDQINNFMKQTLPNIMANAKNSGGGTYNIPITVNVAGNADKNTVDYLVDQVINKVNNVFNQRGYMRKPMSV